MSVADDIKEQYPTLAWLINDPEVGPLLRDAVDPNKGFSSTTFQAKLYQTKWFKSRSTTRRSMEILQHTDPGEYARLIKSNRDQLSALSRRLGVNLSIQEQRYMADQNLKNGVEIGSNEFMWNMYAFAKGQKDTRFGAGSVKASGFQVKEMAREQFFLPMSEKDSQQWGLEMALGLKDETSLREYLSERAASLYPHLKEQLQGGASMEDLFSGHRAIIAEELELAPDSIDFGSQYKQVIHQIDPATGKPRPMTLHETQKLARTDKRWWETAKGREADAGMANTMLKMFGKRG